MKRLLLLIAFAAPLLAQWGKTEWGMTPEQLEAAYPGQLSTTPVRTIAGKPYGENLATLAGVTLDGTRGNESFRMTYTAYFVFEAGKGLQRVYLDSDTPDLEKATREALFVRGIVSHIGATDQYASATYRLLESRYGMPRQSAGRGVLKAWLTPNTKVIFSHAMSTIVYVARGADNGL